MEIRHPGDLNNFHRKLMKFWIQSFLLGVPKIIVGYRSLEGKLLRVEEIQTDSIPDTVSKRPNPSWNGNLCVNFAAEFLDCKWEFWPKKMSRANQTGRASECSQRRRSVADQEVSWQTQRRGLEGGEPRTWGYLDG